MAYEVKLEVFEGPLDLLLHLITKQRVDIYEVSISTITDEYLRALKSFDALDLEVATGFLVVAATLLELKSARLLPSTRFGDDERLLEERDLLLARLVECATYRDAGAWLATQLATGADLHGRAVPLDPELAAGAPDLLARVTVDDLVGAAFRVLQPRPEIELDVSHVQPIRASVRDAIVEVAGRLRSGPAGFRELCAGTTGRLEQVVRFLALLELFKAGAVDLTQSDRFGDIRAEWTNELADEELLVEVDEYAMEGES